MNFLSYYNDVINSFIWGKLGLAMLIFSGVTMTVALRFFQLRHIKLWWSRTFGTLFENNVSRSGDSMSISRFQSMCTALAATLGVGNIVGVSSAIYIGGPGAVFWMWVAAILGMMTNYSENVLGIYFRRKNFDGQWSGGAMYYLRDGLGRKKGMRKISVILAWLFAFFTLFASFGIGSMGQVNKIIINLESAFRSDLLSGIVLYEDVTLYSLLMGIGLFLLAAVIISGGIKRIARFTEKIVPFMIVFFTFGCLVVIIKNYANIIPAVRSIFLCAYTSDAGVGGAVGTSLGLAFEQGFKKGVFSNESGLGSTVMIHANSDITEPCEQGMWGIFEVFVDTILVCTMTALVILTSGVYDLSGTSANVNDATMVASAFNSVFTFGNFGEKFIAISIFLFAFTSVLGWNHYGAKAWEYLFGTNHTYIYRALHLLSIICGSLLTSSLAWDISDTFNGLMMIPNLIAVIALSGTVIKITNNYMDRTVRRKNILPMLSVFTDIQKRAHHKFYIDN